MKTAEPDQKPKVARRRWAHSQVRLAKQILRPFPRKATIHRWPVLKWFSKTARKTPYLWSFGLREVSRAIYLGSIIAFLPIMGLQFLFAFFIALAVRANLPVIMGVQLVSNLITAVAIYSLTAVVGYWIMDLFGISFQEDNPLSLTYAWTIGGIAVGLVFGFIVDMAFRFFVVRRLNKRVDVERMLKS